MAAAQPELRTVMVVSGDARLRHRLKVGLTELRWRVREAAGGAQAMMLLDQGCYDAMILDSWLPDLQVRELQEQVSLICPEMDLLSIDGDSAPQSSFGGRPVIPRRPELLHAIRQAQGPEFLPVRTRERFASAPAERVATSGPYRMLAGGGVSDGSLSATPAEIAQGRSVAVAEDPGVELLPGLVGVSRAMREVAELVRLVAPGSAAVLIEGETGTGKEVIAKNVHQLSQRAGKPFVVLNCAAIPESLLEAELYGHTRGAFTGAVQSRIGRIEAAHGGTLLLDEIGEMPVGMQAKMLRFLECGELQRVGENEPIRVDVRLIAATHQPLEKRAGEGTFRLDLYHRLAVFPIEVLPLRERMEDIAALTEYFLEKMAQKHPRKRLRSDALARLHEHVWPGNIRELMHVLERAAILSGNRAEIKEEDIRYGRIVR